MYATLWPNYKLFMKASKEENIQSTDHELIPATSASLAASKVPRAEVMFVTIQRERIRPTKKKMNKAQNAYKLPDVCS
jgi:hypothetical protein